MNAGVLLFVVADVKDYLVSKSLLDTNGNLTGLSVGQDIEIAVVVETSLKNHGVTIQPEIDKVLKILPLVLQLVGIS